MNWVSCASFTPDDLSHGPGCWIRYHDVWCLLDHNELAGLDAEEQRRWLAVSRSWLPVRGLQSCWTDVDVLCPLSVSRLFWNTHHSVAGGSSGISRQSVDIRLQVSGAIPTKQGNRSLFTDKVVEQQDSQDQRLKGGYSLRDGVSSYVIDVSVAQQAETQMTVAEPSAVETFEVLASAIKQVSTNPTVDGHLSVHRQLQEIEDKGWSVPTRVLARVLGQSNSSLHGWGPVTHRLGFLIERIGSRGMFRVSVDRDQ